MQASFYSRLVRLEAPRALHVQGGGAFLFQIGSIRRKIAVSFCSPRMEFLFQIGSIRSVVRLTFEGQEISGFLFQIGSIRRKIKAVLEGLEPGFYSRLVRLEGPIF